MMILRSMKRLNIDEEEHKKNQTVKRNGSHNKKQRVKRKGIYEQKKKGTVKKRKDFYGEQNKRTIVKKSKNVNDHPPPHLPEELIFDSILTKLPARSLALCSCASKLWYNSIYNDARFASSHFVQNQNRLSLVFNLLNVPEGDTEKVYIFSLEKGAVNDDYFSYISLFDFQLKNELVGYCNGLACVKVAPEHVGTVGAITVFNPIRGESLVLSYLAPGGYIHLCHGFGFDSSSHKYKAVIIFTSKGNDEFVCMVFTLGTNSWRKLTTTAAEISLPPGSSSPYSGRIVTRISRKRCPSASATLCGGDLLWRITNQVLEEDIINHDDNDNKIEMLLSFDLHNEKIQFVRLPAESTLTPTIDECQHLIVDHHLFEFKGYPCIARFEKIMNSNGHQRSYDQNSCCCCCCKVHLYLLTDKVKQVWIKGETFDIQIKGHEGLLPAPFCCYFDTAAATTPPTRMLTFSDQVLLYWFDGDSLIFYNLQTKYLNVVKGSRSYPGIFPTERNGSQANGIGSVDNNYSPYMNYQLHAQVENIISLKTFIPPDAKVSKSNSFDDFKQLVEEKSPAGWVITGRELSHFYAFF